MGSIIAPDLQKQTNKRTPYISTYINKLLGQIDVLMAGLRAMRQLLQDCNSWWWWASVVWAPSFTRGTWPVEPLPI